MAGTHAAELIQPDRHQTRLSVAAVYFSMFVAWLHVSTCWVEQKHDALTVLDSMQQARLLFASNTCAQLGNPLGEIDARLMH